MAYRGLANYVVGGACVAFSAGVYLYSVNLVDDKDFADDFKDSHMDKVNVHKSGLKATVPDDSPLAKEIAARPISTVLGLQILEGEEGKGKLLMGYGEEGAKKEIVADSTESIPTHTSGMTALEAKLVALREAEKTQELSSERRNEIRAEKAAVKNQIRQA